MKTIALLCLFTLAHAVTQAGAPNDHSARNVELLRQYYALGKAREHQKQAAMWAPDAINLGKPVQHDSVRIAIEDIHRAFPDYHSEVLETRASADTVVQMSRMSGTHQGMAQTTIFGGLLKDARPTGRRFEVLVTHWWRFNESGKITWHQVTRDDLGMYLQLGLLPGRLATEKGPSPVKEQT
jgi:hypothetical protein